jgi:hypothetical protein
MRRITSSMSNGSFIPRAERAARERVGARPPFVSVAFAPLRVRRMAMTARGGKNGAHRESPRHQDITPPRSRGARRSLRAVLRLVLHLTPEAAERVHDAVVALAQERGEDVLAQLLAPQMVAAIASRMRRRVQIHPVVVIAAGHVIPAVADTLAMQQQAPSQPRQIDAAHGVDVDRRFLHRPAPNPREIVYETAHPGTRILPENERKSSRDEGGNAAA